MLTLQGDFQHFWDTYGRKVGIDAAKRAYNKAIKKVSHEEIIRGVTAYQDQERSRGTERKYIKHASTWLNKCGWNDEYHTEGQKLTKHERAMQALGLDQRESGSREEIDVTPVDVF